MKGKPETIREAFIGSALLSISLGVYIITISGYYYLILIGILVVLVL